MLTDLIQFKFSIILIKKLELLSKNSSNRLGEKPNKIIKNTRGIKIRASFIEISDMSEP